MAKNPKQYGLDKLVPDAALDPDTVVTNYAVSFPLVADITGSSVGTIEELNPSLLRGRTPPDESYELHIPAGTTALYNQRIAEIPEDKRTSWRFHVLNTGETLDDVARLFHTTASEIAFTNQLDANSSLDGVTSLVVPEEPPAVASSSTRGATYRVRRGETLVNIADQFGVSVESLERWNHLRGHTVAAGRSLYISEPARIAHRAARHGSGTHAVSSAAASRRTKAHAAQAVHASTSSHTKRRR